MAKGGAERIEGAGGLRSSRLKRIYESSRGWLEVEAFETFDSREVWLTFFDREGFVSHRFSWGSDARGSQ